MEFAFTEEQEAFKKEVRDFLKEELPWGLTGDVAWSYSDDLWEFHRAFMRKLGAKGWIAISWPREYGGQGRSFVDQLILIEELAYYRAPRLGPETIIVGPPILAHGSEELKKKFIPMIAKGEIVVCQGFSEPDAGSDVASLRTLAVEEGDHFIVNGQKIWTTFAHRADYCWLAARTDPEAPKHKGISMFLVDMKTPGITVQPIIDMHGEHELNEVFFDDVQVPKENLIGQKNHGWYQMITGLDFERSVSGALWYPSTPAGLKRTVEDLVDYAKRIQCDGELLAKNPLIQHRLAQLAIEIELCRLFFYRVASMASKGLVASTEAAMANLYLGELACRVAEVGMRILGLRGILRSDSKWAPLRGDIERLSVGCIVLRFGPASSEIEKNIIATRGLRLPRFE